MKKTIGIILMIAGVVATLMGVVTIFCFKASAPASISIIGGADGPTSIFLAGKMGPKFGEMVVGIIMFVCGLLLVLLKKKPNQ